MIPERWLLFLLPLSLASGASAEVREEVWGEQGGQPVKLFALGDATGLEVQVLSYGATLVSVRVPDRAGNREEIVLRLDSLDGYLGPHPLFGSTVGRFANRIDGGGFEIDGVRHELASVHARTGVHIHGGPTGFQRQNWQATVTGPAEVTFSLTSPDGHEGYPGTVEATVTYRVEGGNQLVTAFSARTSAPTHVNLTNHTYWNLGGWDAGTVLDQELHIAADERLELDDRKIPTGRLIAVADTAFDFRVPRRIGEGIEAAGGYDHCFVLRTAGDGVVARLHDPRSGRTMSVESTAPGVQFYVPAQLAPTLSYRGQTFGPRAALCLEFQHFPDTPNHPAFPPTLLRPGGEYRQVTTYRFSVR